MAEDQHGEQARPVPAAPSRPRAFDRPTEEHFDNVVRLTARLCRAPVASIALVDGDMLWFKSTFGVSEPGFPLRGTACELAMASTSDLLVIEDLAADGRLAPHAELRGRGFRAFAGVVLRAANGKPLGVLTVIDHEPRAFTRAELAALRTLGRQVQLMLEQCQEIVELRPTSSGARRSCC